MRLLYVDVEIKNVILDDLRQSPYSARSEFEKVYSNPADRSELKRETALETGPDHLGRSARNRGAHVAVGVVLQRRPCRITRDDPRQFGRAGAESLCQSGHAQPRQTTFSDTEAVDLSSMLSVNRAAASSAKCSPFVVTDVTRNVS